MNLIRIRDGNWGLKLLALVLAIVIYHTLKNDSATGRRNHDQQLFQQHP